MADRIPTTDEIARRIFDAWADARDEASRAHGANLERLTFSHRHRCTIRRVFYLYGEQTCMAIVALRRAQWLADPDALRRFSAAIWTDGAMRWALAELQRPPRGSERMPVGRNAALLRWMDGGGNGRGGDG